MPEGMSADPSRAGTPGMDVASPGASMAPPAGTPSANEAPAKGETEQAKANVQIAIVLLEQTLPMLGTDSEEGKAVLKALTMLSKSFAGKKSQDLAPAELMQLISGMPDSIKQQMAGEMGGGSPQGMTSGGIPNGPHIPANIT